jgi:hypothetical protein
MPCSSIAATPGRCSSVTGRTPHITCNEVSRARELARYLLPRISDERTLRSAWDYLAHEGDPAPGPNGRRYSDLTGADAWGLCRCLRQVIRAGRYGRGGERVQWISKGPGRGQRPLVLSNIEDRVVERAAVSILSPVLDPLFDDGSFGYRPQRGHLDALALAEEMAIEENRRVWLAVDVKDAFLNVPVRRLLDIVRSYLPAADLVDFLGRVLTPGALPGLRQGGPLSPLMLNLFLHHLLDRPWRRDHTKAPLVRFADDLLVPCRTEAEARAAYGDLQRLLVPAGMPLKESEDQAIHVLDRDVAVDWLGFAITWSAQGLAVRIGARAWHRLDESLALAHTKPDAPLRAIRTIEGWLGQRGPCYDWSDRDEVLRRIAATAAGYAFDEIPGAAELEESWRRAGDRWHELQQAASTRRGTRRGGTHGAAGISATQPDAAANAGHWDVRSAVAAGMTTNG